MRVLEKVGFRLVGRSHVAHPPKFPKPIEVSQFVLTRDGVVRGQD